MPPVRLTPIPWDALPGWAEDHHASALSALRRTARHVATNGPHKTGSLGPGGESFLPALNAALRTDDGDARTFFEERFAPHRIEGDRLGGPDGEGFVTGFYEPVIEASERRAGSFRYPIHARPPALAKNDGTVAAGASLPHGWQWGMRGDDGLLHAAPDRSAIERGTAPHVADWPVIAWARDRVDLYFAHIQGAARLAMTDGTERRITYAAKSGHPFTAIGAELARDGEIEAAAVTMDTIREWLAAHPDRADALMRRNRSYIFFREEPVDEPELGPVAAARVPLSPGRSLAVDRLLHTFGTPVFVEAPSLHMNGAPFARLMVAQETGTAIVGAARGDIFTGSGHAAGRVAGAIRAAARFTMLVPR